MISTAMNAKLNKQITNEMHAAQVYLAAACMFNRMGLANLETFFRRQSDEERRHALKMLDYVLEVDGKVTLEAIPKPEADLSSVTAAINTAVEHEKKVTRQIHDLVALAERDKDYATRSFLNWFVDEQVEEVSSTSGLLKAAKLAGDHLLALDTHVGRLNEAGKD